MTMIGRCLVTLFTLVSVSSVFESAGAATCTAPWPCLNSGRFNNTGRPVASVANCDSTGNTDYFPIKVTPDYSTQWNVSYHMYYKILTNTRANQRYVLYQRGCTAPVVSFQAPAIAVPVTSVEITSSTFETYIAILGERESIVVSSAFGGVYSADPCMQAQFVAGHTADRSCSGTCVGGACAKEPEIAFVGFSGGRCPASSVANVSVSESAETELLAQVEWIEFFSTFFNKEGAILTYVADLDASLACLATSIENYRAANGLARPKVLWATPPGILPPSAASEWASVGTCPNYYCEAIVRAGGEILNNRSAVASLAPAYNPATFRVEGGPNSSVLFAAGVAGDADVILVPGSLSTPSFAALTSAQCDTIYASTALLPPSVPAVASRRVYDNGAIRDPSGGTDWFASRLATPDVLVETIAAMLYPGMNIRGSLGLAWWQNVYTESACIPVAGIPTVLDTVVQCNNASDLFRPGRNSVCATPTAAPTSIPTVAPTRSTSGGSRSEGSNDSSLSTLNVSLIAGCSAFAIIALVLLMFYMSTRRQLIELTGEEEPVMNWSADDQAAIEEREL